MTSFRGVGLSRDRGFRRGVWLRSSVVIAVLGCLPVPAWAQVPQTLNGAPVQVTPYAAEFGVPLIAVTPGTVVAPTPAAGAAGQAAGAGGNTNALNTMLGQSWGNTAESEALAVGVNSSALAATCVIESGCGAKGS